MNWPTIPNIPSQPAERKVARTGSNEALVVRSMGRGRRTTAAGHSGRWNSTSAHRLAFQWVQSATSTFERRTFGPEATGHEVRRPSSRQSRDRGPEGAGGLNPGWPQDLPHQTSIGRQGLTALEDQGYIRNSHKVYYGIYLFIIGSNI